MRLAQGTGISISPIRTMMNHATTELFFDDLRVPAENLIGEEGQGFRYILSGMNAERILIAAECIGDAKWFIAKASAYAKEREVFGRPIGQNQGVQFPIARAYAQMRAAELMVREAAARYQAGEDCGAEAGAHSRHRQRHGPRSRRRGGALPRRNGRPPARRDPGGRWTDRRRRNRTDQSCLALPPQRFFAPVRFFASAGGERLRGDRL